MNNIIDEELLNSESLTFDQHEAVLMRISHKIQERYMIVLPTVKAIKLASTLNDLFGYEFNLNKRKKFSGSTVYKVLVKALIFNRDNVIDYFDQYFLTIPKNEDIMEYLECLQMTTLLDGERIYTFKDNFVKLFDEENVHMVGSSLHSVIKDDMKKQEFGSNVLFQKSINNFKVVGEQVFVSVNIEITSSLLDPIDKKERLNQVISQYAQSVLGVNYEFEIHETMRFLYSRNPVTNKVYVVIKDEFSKNKKNNKNDLALNHTLSAEVSVLMPYDKVYDCIIKGSFL